MLRGLLRRAAAFHHASLAVGRPIPNRRRLQYESLESRAMLTTASGDFNADGYDDLVVGSPYADVNGKVNAGAVNVIYGGAGGLSAAADQQWHQDRPSVLSTAKAGELFGFSLAVGDFNNDGFDDLAIGVPYEDVHGKSDAGAVNILYGSAAGLSASKNQLYYQREGDAGTNDRFAYSLAAGDFNGDGRDDLAVGVPLEDIGSATNAGGVHVIYGSTSSGLRKTGHQFWHQNSAGIDGVAGKNDRFGDKLVTGDFNADGFDDLAVGVPNDDVTTRFSWQWPDNDIGAANVIYGAEANGLSAAGDQRISWNREVERNEHFATALTVGDFNADGYDDLVALSAGLNLTAGAVGSLSVGFGSENKLEGSSLRIGLRGGFGVTAGATIAAGKVFGDSLTVGDFDDDGFDDLAIGIHHNVGEIGFPDVAGGIVAVLSGTQFDPDVWTAWNAQIFEQGVNGLQSTSLSGEKFGRALTAGDYNGDGKADLAIGVPGEDTSRINAGAVHVIYGTMTGLDTAGDQLWSLDTPFINGDPEVNGQFGLSLA